MIGSIILTGDVGSKNEYIAAYIRDNNIPSYYITRFTDPLKISEARNIISNLAQKMEEGSLRLFIIESIPTVEAQNSLLKTIEEIDDNTTIIFMDDNLLPTIHSRSAIINLNSLQATKLIDQIDLNLISNLPIAIFSNSYLLFLDNFFSEKRDDPIADLILLLRKSMMNAISEKKIETVKSICNLLNEFMFYYPLVKSNNLNSRLISERIFINTIG